MFRKSLYDTLDSMSYEERKQAEIELSQHLEDTQQYDDSCNVVEVLVEAVVNVVKVIAKNLF